MEEATKNLFHVIDNSGEHYFVEAVDLGDAYNKFRGWEENTSGTPRNEIEEPQSIAHAGSLCVLIP